MGFVPAEVVAVVGYVKSPSQIATSKACVSTLYELAHCRVHSSSNLVAPGESHRPLAYIPIPCDLPTSFTPNSQKKVGFLVEVVTMNGGGVDSEWRART